MSTISNKAPFNTFFLILLAGCGGDGGSSAATSAGSASQTTTNTTVQFMQDASSTESNTAHPPADTTAANPLIAPTARTTNAPADDSATDDGAGTADDNTGATIAYPQIRTADGEENGDPARTAITTSGISGEVLAAMLDQRSNARLHTATSATGARPADSTVQDVTTTQFRDVPYAGQSTQGNGPLGSYSAVNGAFLYTAFNGSPVDNATADASVNSIGLDLAVTSGDTLTLAASLIASDLTGTNYKNGPTYTGSGYTVAKTATIPYGTLAQWRNGSYTVQLQVQALATDQAALCWNFTLPATIRLYCNLWALPANWAAGQPLEHRGAYIHDQTQGNSRFWNSN